MMKTLNLVARWPRLGGALALVLWIMAAIAAVAAAAQSPLQSTVVTGSPVVDAAGRNIAQVADLVIDPAEGRVVSVVIALSDPAAAGRLVAIPLPAQGAAYRDGKLVLDIAAPALREMPSFNMGELGAPGPAGEPPRHRRASEILAAEMRQKDGRDIGDIDDLLFRLDDAVVLGIAVKFDPKWLEMESDSLLALPFSSAKPEGKDFVALFEPKDVRPSKGLPGPAAAAPAQAAPAAPPPPPPIDPEARLSRLVGAVVVDADGAAMGKVDDALVDMGSRRMTHALISLAPAGAAPRRVELAFPAAGLDWEPGKLTYIGDVSKLPSAEGASAAGQQGVMRATELLKSKVADDTGQEVGSLEDVVVNLRSGQVHFAVAKFTPNWIQAGMLVGIPLRPLKPLEDDKGLAMKFGLNELNRAYIFNASQWPDLNNPQVRALISGYMARMQ
jgi:sporulation protein YlmC with PRC-barrel domain